MKFIYNLRYETWTGQDNYYTDDDGKYFLFRRGLALVLTDGINEYKIYKPTRAVGFYLFNPRGELDGNPPVMYDHLTEYYYIRYNEVKYAELVLKLTLSDEKDFCREELEKLIMY